MTTVDPLRRYSSLVPKRAAKVQGPSLLTFVCQGLILGAIVLVMEVFVSPLGTSQDLVVYALVGTALLPAEVLVLRGIENSLLTPTVIFFGLLWLFTWGQMTLLTVGVKPRGADVLNRLSSGDISTAAHFFLFAYWAACSGALIYARLASVSAIRPESPNLPAQIDYLSAMRSVGIAGITVGVIPYAITTWHNLDVVVEGGYSAYYAAGARLDSPVLSLGYAFILGLVLIGIAGRGNSPRVAVFAIVAICVLRLLAGDRGEGLTFLVTAVLLWSRTSSASNARVRTAYVLTAIAAILTIPIVGELRHAYGGDVVDVAVADDPVTSTFRTTGGTLYPLVKIVELTETEGFQGGQTYIAALFAISPSPISEILLDAAGIDRSLQSPGNWLQNRLALSYGPGFTPFAEAYFNFGSSGGIVAMGVAGALFACILRTRSSSVAMAPVRLMFAMTSFALIGFSVRGSANIVFPYLVKFVVLPTVAVIVLSHREFRHRKARAAKAGGGSI